MLNDCNKRERDKREDQNFLENHTFYAFLKCFFFFFRNRHLFRMQALSACFARFFLCFACGPDPH